MTTCVAASWNNVNWTDFNSYVIISSSYSYISCAPARIIVKSCKLTHQRLALRWPALGGSERFSKCGMEVGHLCQSVRVSASPLFPYIYLSLRCYLARSVKLLSYLAFVNSFLLELVYGRIWSQNVATYHELKGWTLPSSHNGTQFWLQLCLSVRQLRPGIYELDDINKYIQQLHVRVNVLTYFEVWGKKNSNMRTSFIKTNPHS